MADKLGINLDPPSFANPNPEYFVLWLAVEALRAPLPAPWRSVNLGRTPYPCHTTHTRTRTRTRTRTPMFCNSSRCIPCAPCRLVKLEHDIPEEGWLQGDSCYEDAISQERTASHPLLDAFKEQVCMCRSRPSHAHAIHIPCSY